MYVKKVVSVVFLAVVLFLAGCNLFGWMDVAPGTGGSSQDLTDAGYIALNAGEPEKALSYFEEAIEGDPANSLARLGYAKALLFSKLPEIWKLVNDFEDQTNESDLVNIINVMNKPEYRDIVIEGGRGGVFKKLVDVLDDPEYGVFSEKSDGEVNPTDIMPNLLTIIGYVGTFFANFLDTSGNGVFGDSDDLVTVNPDGTYTIMEMDEIQSNVDALTNVSSGDSIVEVLSNLKELHDNDERLLGLAKTIYGLIHYLDRTIAVFDRLNSRSDIRHFGDVEEQLNDAKSNVVDVKTNIYTLITNMAEILNRVHSSIVGDYAYPSSKGIEYFVPSPWDSHSGGLKGSLESLLETTSVLTDTNVSNIIDTITNNLTEEDLSNIYSLLSNINL